MPSETSGSRKASFLLQKLGGVREMALTAKQELFCKEYIVDLNATQAAIRAGYSEKTAEIIGHENLRKPYIAKRVQQLIDKRSNKVEIKADDVLRYLDDVLHTSTTDIVTVVTKQGKRHLPNGDVEDIEYQTVEVRDTETLTAAQKAAIASIKQTKDGIEVKLHDKTKIAELAMRHLGLLIERKEITGAGGEPIQLVVAAMTDEELERLANGKPG